MLYFKDNNTNSLDANINLLTTLIIDLKKNILPIQIQFIRLKNLEYAY
jgi:hypothetical protein